MTGTKTKSDANIKENSNTQYTMKTIPPWDSKHQSEGKKEAAEDNPCKNTLWAVTKWTKCLCNY